jgi:2-haloacid dehalogenase
MGVGQDNAGHGNSLEGCTGLSTGATVAPVPQGEMPVAVDAGSVWLADGPDLAYACRPGRIARSWHRSCAAGPCEEGLVVTGSTYVFDAYGTHFDVHSAAARHQAAIGAEWERFSERWRSKHLEYTWVLSMIGRHSTFRKLLEQSLDTAAASVGGISAVTRAALLEAYDTLSAYPEVKEAFTELKRKRARLAILSNGDADMLQRAVASAGLGDQLNAVFTVAEVGVFKPSARVYRHAATRLGVDKAEITFVSANRWDVAGAQAFGFKTVWLNRTKAADEYPDLPPAMVIADLMGLL